jgi:opacity protein-like surface antigen
VATELRRAGELLEENEMTSFIRLGIAVAAIAIAFSAQAADMRAVYKAAVPVAPSSWSGFYLGVNAGGSIGIDSTRQTTTYSSTALGSNVLLDNSGRYAPDRMGVRRSDRV